MSRHSIPVPLSFQPLMFSLHTRKFFAFQLKKLGAAVAMAMLFSNTGATGWGDLTVRSSLGQPLLAEIELASAPRQDHGALTVKLASQETYRHANIEFNPVLMSLRFAIEHRGDKQFVRVTSTQPVNEPFIDMLLELSSGTGRTVREYVFLLDPTGNDGAQVATVVPVGDAVAQQLTASSSVPGPAATPTRQGVRKEATVRQSMAKTVDTTNTKPRLDLSGVTAASVTDDKAAVIALEQKITELQNLLDVTDKQLADLRTRNEGAKTTLAVKRAAPAPASAPVAATTPAPKPEEDASYLIPGAGLLLALFGVAGIYSARRRKAKTPYETSRYDDAQRDKPTTVVPGDAASTALATGMLLHTGYGHTQLHDVDPLAEADVYIAYGRDVQAEDILKEALNKQPDSLPIRVKLLSIYAGRKDVKSFDVLARELHGMTQGEGGEWEHAAELGREIDPANPLYAVKAVQRAVDVSSDATLVLERIVEDVPVDATPAEADIPLPDLSPTGETRGGEPGPNRL